MLKTSSLLLALAVAAASSAPSKGITVIYDEFSSSDLSDNPLAPTVLGAVVEGVNEVTGRVSALNFDVFSFSIPSGLRLLSIDVSNISTNNPFVYVAWGTDEGGSPPGGGFASWTSGLIAVPNDGTLTSIVGGTDLLSFSTYTVGVQAPPTALVSPYSVFITTIAIPEPATATLGLLAFGGLMLRRRRVA